MCDDQFFYCMVGKPRPHRDLNRRQKLAGSRTEGGESEDPVVLPDQGLELPRVSPVVRVRRIDETGISASR
jgi:hypothetical protein